MTENQKNWAKIRDELIIAVSSLGFPEELGAEIARQLGSPKAMQQMLGYLYNVKPNSAELIVDEMLAIRSDIEAWKEKKESEAANASYNDFLNNGF